MWDRENDRGMNGGIGRMIVGEMGMIIGGV